MDAKGNVSNATANLVASAKSCSQIIDDKSERIEISSRTLMSNILKKYILFQRFHGLFKYKLASDETARDGGSSGCYPSGKAAGERKEEALRTTQAALQE